MDQIIPVVAKHLWEETPEGVPVDVVWSMTQRRMRQVHKAEPLQADLKTSRWLCSTVQMSKHPAGLVVTLPANAACKAQIQLADPNPRAVLSDQCRHLVGGI